MLADFGGLDRRWVRSMCEVMLVCKGGCTHENSMRGSIFYRLPQTQHLRSPQCQYPQRNNSNEYQVIFRELSYLFNHSRDLIIRVSQPPTIGVSTFTAFFKPVRTVAARALYYHVSRAVSSNTLVKILVVASKTSHWVEESKQIRRSLKGRRDAFFDVSDEMIDRDITDSR